MEMELKNPKLKDIFQLSKEDTLNLFYEHMITIPITARTALTKELISTIGLDRTKGIFIRYGWHCGVSDAQKAMQFEWESELELIKIGPKFHILHGYLGDVEIVDIKMDQANQLEVIELMWTNSFEAEEFLKDGHVSNQPVCHTLCGYASGYLSTVLNRSIIVKEVECRAMGHDKCRAICRPIEKWGEELENEYSYYQSTSMIQELDEVTAKLKVERDYLKQANEVQRKLTHQLLSNQGIQGIVDVLFDTTGLPTFIENEYHKVLVKSEGVSIDFDLEPLDTDCTQFIRISPHVSILRTPIFFEQQIKGFCSFLYPANNGPTDLDYMIIDKAALTASVILLNENIKISTEQNVKRNFLNDVLEKRLEREEIYKIAYYLKFPPNEPYWMLTVERTISPSDVDHEFETNEELIRHIHLFLQERNINAIVSQKSDKMIVLIEYATFTVLGMKPGTFINQLLKHCVRRFKKHQFSIGVSSVVENISQLDVLYKETVAALKAKNAMNQIYYFEELEMESILFQVQDDMLIDRFIQKQLGGLLCVDKDFDLTKTLYTYIESGININNTAKSLCMSISGLRYRLSKISNILDIQLDDTKKIFSIYMALKILRAKGQLTI